MLKLNEWYKWKDSSKRGKLCFIDPGKTFVTLENLSKYAKDPYWNVSYHTFVTDWEKFSKK